MSSPFIERRQKAERARILEELRKVPIASVACQRTGIARATFYRWREADSQFADDVEEAMRIGTETINDMSESQLIALIKDKSANAIRYWLENNHPKYMKARRNVVVEHDKDNFRVEIPYEQSQ